ncbi:MAG TPA: F0F1 ATP synthase subunit gamma [Mycobacteriales bacterium]|jgi:F-type H+-transporting ATPase subunit gamma|nr:F0F1 ATP synthase subunit gamma [Mycobacteriales bacterium]
MPASLRVYRQRIRSVEQTKKITKAMELIAASRIAKARARVDASRPYAEEITRVLTALASSASVDHPLLVERPEPKRAAVLVVTSDRGLAGGYSANAIKAAEELQALLREEGKEARLFVIGRKGVGYYRFRDRPIVGDWTGFSEQPRYTDARAAGDTLIRLFDAGADDTAEGPGGDQIEGVDELHIVYTEFVNMVTQRPVAKRIAPLVVEESEEAAPSGLLPEYEFEPEPEELLNALLPKYINTRIYSALLESAASESAARQRAMQSASDNADELVITLKRELNQARQAAITQEISEIVGGADALAASN